MKNITSCCFSSPKVFEKHPHYIFFCARELVQYQLSIFDCHATICTKILRSILYILPSFTNTIHNATFVQHSCDALVDRASASYRVGRLVFEKFGKNSKPEISIRNRIVYFQISESFVRLTKDIETKFLSRLCIAIELHRWEDIFRQIDFLGYEAKPETYSANVTNVGSFRMCYPELVDLKNFFL